MDYSECSNEEIAKAYAEIVKVFNATKNNLDLYENTKKSIEFEFLMRFDKKFREEHDFLISRTTKQKSGATNG